MPHQVFRDVVCTLRVVHHSKPIDTVCLANLLNGADFDGPDFVDDPVRFLDQVVRSSSLWGSR